MKKEHQFSEGVPRMAVIGALVAVLAYAPGCLAADLSGSAVLTIGQGTRACAELFLLPTERASGIDLGEIRNGKLKMDWEFYGQLNESRKRAVASAHCQPNGIFDIKDAPSGPTTVFAHFSWLRGKWVTGGSIVEQINIPSGAPLRLQANLAH